MDYKTCFQGKRVLLAEDDVDSQELMKDIFSGMQISLDLAVDGEEAVDKARQSSYDLIILDVRMPKKDGIEVCKIIRSMEGEKGKVPIFALSAAVMGNEKTVLESVGVQQFIPKPIDIKRLREEMAKIWGIHD